jgi:hypothetical protein
MALENLALRQQLTVFKRPRKADQLSWLCLSRRWEDWRAILKR